MLLRQLTKYILGLAILATSSLALSNTEFTYNEIDGGIELTGCVNECSSNLIIPSSINGLAVFSISEYAFQQEGIENVIIPEGIRVIKRGAFYGNMLSSLALPNTLEYLSGFNSNQISTLAIPNSVTEIGIEAFLYNNLESIVIPGSVGEVGSEAFSSNQLEEVILQTGTNTISGYAFYANQLSSISIPDSVIYIGEKAFAENNLGNMVFPENLSTLDENAFRNNPITSLNFLGEPPLIGNEAFSETFLTSVTYCQNESGEWNDIVIEGVTSQLNEGCDNSTSQYSVFDIDQNNTFDALTDGLILLRYAFGLRGDNLINGAIASDANRTSASEIEGHIQSYLP
jgi:hypothetical protein